MKLWITTAAAIAVLGIGGVASAQTAMSTTEKAMWPTVACRVPMKGDVPNDKMGGVAMYCQKIDYAKARATIMKMMQEAMANGAQPTQAQVEAAYQKAFSDQNLLGQHN